MGCEKSDRVTMIGIDMDKIHCLEENGVHSQIHVVLGRIKNILVSRRHACGESDMENVKHESISQILDLLCASGFICASELEKDEVRDRVKRRLKFKMYVAAAEVSVVGLARHITTSAVEGNMYTEGSIMTKVCNGRVNKPSCFKHIRMGEILCLSFELEENIAKRGLIPVSCMGILVKDVVQGVHAVMKSEENRAWTTHEWASRERPGKEKSCEGGGFEDQVIDSLSAKIKSVIVKIVVEAFLSPECTGKVNYTYSLLCANMMRHYSFQHLHWGNVKDSAMEKRDEHRVIKNKQFLRRLLHQEGRKKVMLELQKMVRVVIGLGDNVTELSVYPPNMRGEVDRKISLLCPCTDAYQIHSEFSYHNTFSQGLCLLDKLSEESNAYDFPDKSDNSLAMMYSNQNDVPSAFHVMSAEIFALPTPLWLLVKHMETSLCGEVLTSDPRYYLILSFRQNILVSYIHILFSVWGNAKGFCL